MVRTQDTEKREAIRKEIRKGKGVRTIAKFLDTSYSTIASARKEHPKKESE